jgi:hypothetical protein
MNTKTLTAEAVAESLRAADFGDTLQACGFRFWSDEALGAIVEVVLILNHDQWDDAAIVACEKARTVTDSALREFGCFALPVCRTRTEHKGFEQREKGIWIPVELHGAC